MRQRSISVIRIRPRPGQRTLGILFVGARALRVALGRAGIRANKREGDGATPRGSFHPVRIWWRADRHLRPRTLLPVRHITPDIAWCEDPGDRRYNRAFRRSLREPGDRLWRDDRLYDLVIQIDHNMRPRVAGRGSAVFLHVARPNGSPTAGCVAMAPGDLQRLLNWLSRNTRILIQI